jgi:hypothetical protein
MKSQDHSQGKEQSSQQVILNILYLISTCKITELDPNLSPHIKINSSWVPVAHACNPSYSGGRNQKDYGSKPAQANSSQDPILRTVITKKGWWSGSRWP